jgi:hypothetical protein
VANPKTKESDYRIAFIDLETAPSLGWVWQKWQTDVIAFEQDWYIMSFSVLWSDRKKPETYCLPDFPLYRKEPENDFELVKKLREVLDSADLIIAHNGDRFDIPKARARLIYHHLPPPSPFKSYDTLLVAKRLFAFTSNKLNDLGVYLDVGEKVETGGFNLWLRCMQGDKASWELMRKYNAQDTLLLKAVYDELKIWDSGHPNITLASNESLRCPACGSSRVQRRGLEYLKSFKVQRFQCTDCHKWSRGKREKLQAQVLA